MKLTKNFTLGEMIYSDTAKAKGIDNTPSEEVIENLKALCENLLQPVRDLYGKAMHVNSGYRSPALNKAVSGSATSDHLVGRSADIKVYNPKELHTLVLNSGLEFDQLILYPTFVHMSFKKPFKDYRTHIYNRMQVSYDSAKTWSIKNP